MKNLLSGFIQLHIMRVDPNYMETVQDREMNPVQRMMLIAWLYNVSRKYKIPCMALMDAVVYLDTYLSRMVVSTKKLQCVGMVCLWISNKFHDKWGNDCTVDDWTYICDKAYTEKEILELEWKVLHVLEYKLWHERSLHTQLNLKDTEVKRYVLLSLLSYPSLRFDTYTVACAVTALSENILPVHLHTNILTCASYILHLERFFSTITDADEYIKSVSGDTAKIRELAYVC